MGLIYLNVFLLFLFAQLKGLFGFSYSGWYSNTGPDL